MHAPSFFLPWSRGLLALLTVSLAPALVAAPSPVALEKGVVVYLPFENNLSAPGGGEGKAVGAVSFDRGVLGSGLALHGDDFVEVPDSEAMHSETLSLCAWVCPRLDHSSGRIAEKGASNSFWLNLADNKVRFGFYSDRYHEVDSGTALKANEWAFVAGTYDGEVLRVYVNGELEGLVKVQETPRFNAQPLVIGWKQHGIAADHFLGWIDEVRLYNRALTKAEVQVLNQTIAR